MKKVILVIVILGLAVLFGWQTYRRFAEKSGGSRGRLKDVSTAVQIMPVQKRDIRDVRYFTGSLLPKSQFIVAPKVSGRLEKLHVDMGDTVERGQLIAVLDSQEYAQNVEQARAELKVAKANVLENESARDVAKRELERIKVLREKKIASESELDEAEAAYKTAESKYTVSLAQVEQKEAALRTAEIRLSFTRINASWEGGSGKRFVGERFASQGDMLGANDSIVSVMDIDVLIAAIYVTEESYSNVRTGQPIVISADAYPGKKFAGKIVRISPVLQETSRSARVEAELFNHNHLLKPGLFVQAEIEILSRNNATLVPFSSLVSRESKQGVFLVDMDEKKARFVPVITGIITAEWAEILEPELGGHVVTLGQHLLEDGSSVILPEKNNNHDGSGNTGIKKPSGSVSNAGGRK
ncbi:MAG TPA: efflux RND transporter periplasmic adaptor subunit [bacterium]|nr:efflux RND transporter periplasmic adaptor subunit [bacterium]